MLLLVSGGIVRVAVQTVRDTSSAASFPYARTNNVSTCLTRQHSFAMSIFSDTSSPRSNPVVRVRTEPSTPNVSQSRKADPKQKAASHFPEKYSYSHIRLHALRTLCN